MMGIELPVAPDQTVEFIHKFRGDLCRSRTERSDPWVRRWREEPCKVRNRSWCRFQYRGPIVSDMQGMGYIDKKLAPNVRGGASAKGERIG